MQKHAARRLHYDLRLQFGDVLKSWAVTREPSFDPRVRRLAVHVEDHPLDYARFEGTIPKGQYGAGRVEIWDRGTWVPTADPDDGYARGVLKFRLAGEKMAGGWTLVRLKGRKPEDRGRDNWLLIKERDPFARPETDDPTEATDRSIEASEPAELPDKPAAPSRRRNKKAETPAITIAELPGARAAGLPEFVAPQLAAPTDQPPDGEEWLHEIKLDGYRSLVRIEDGAVRILTRSGHDWTRRYGRLDDTFRSLPCRRALIDGEIVVQDERGVADFAALQQALASGETRTLVFFAFDLLYLDDRDLRDVRLLQRKQALASLLAGTDRHSAFHLSEHVEAGGRRLLVEACRMQVEGIVSKRRDAPYHSGRSRSWRKCRCFAAGDFVILGFTRSEAAGGLAALVLAEATADGALHCVGKTGTGFTRAIATDLEHRLATIRADAPAAPVPAEIRRDRPIWVEPRLMAEVRYATRTADGRLRQAVYRGLRPDKPPSVATEAEVVPVAEDDAMTTPKPSAGGDASPRRKRWVSDTDLASVWVTNPDRVMFGGPTKLDLALYYARVGDWLLPELAGRPLTLVRCPSGRAEDCFYQRNATPGMPEAVGRTELPAADGDAPETVVHVDDAAGLLALAQFGVVELHCRGCRVGDAGRPDRLVFDLDPDEALGWQVVVEAALLLRERLSGLGLVPFVKTTGGKGLHVVVPIVPDAGWSRTLAFTEGIAAALAKEDPRRFTRVMAKKARRGRIFIDYLRNGRTATAVAAYSLRARPGVTVATPVSWQELPDLEGASVFDYRSVPERLSRLRSDPWMDLDTSARVIPKEAWRFAGLPADEPEEA